MAEENSRDEKATSPHSPSLPATVPEHLSKADQSARSDAQNDPERNQEQYRVEAKVDVTLRVHEQIRQAKEFMKERDKLFNPPKFRKLEKDALPLRPDVESLLKDTVIVKVPYYKMWPRDCTDEVIEMAEATRAPIHTTLNMFIRIPKVLLDATQPTKLEIYMDIHGGGGFTGSPTYVPWLFKALLQYQLSKKDVIVVGPSYPFLLESNGDEILQNNSRIWTWLFTSLQPTLSKLNSNLEVAWEHFSLSSVSFGCALAFHLVFIVLGSRPDKPPGFRIRKMLARSNLTGTYSRDNGYYMGVPVSQEEAEAYSEGMRRLKTSGRLMPRQASIDPPARMFGAYASAVSCVTGTTWCDFWDYHSVHDLVEKGGVCPNEGIRVDFVRGEDDQLVKPQDTLDQVECLRRKFPDVDVRCHVRLNEGHAGDNDEDVSYYADFFAW